jgi:hypothetical protein
VTLPPSISQDWLVDSLMHAFAAVLHGASFDGSGLGLGVVVFGGVFVVVFDGVVLLDVGVDDSVVVVGAFAVVAGDEVTVAGEELPVVAGTVCCPAAKPTGVDGDGDEQALSTAAAATAAPTISFFTRIVVSPSTGDPYTLKTTCSTPGLRPAGLKPISVMSLGLLGNPRRVGRDVRVYGRPAAAYRTVVAGPAGHADKTPLGAVFDDLRPA